MGIHLYDHGTDIYSTCSGRINSCLSSGRQCSTYSTGTDEQLRRNSNGDTDITDDHTCVLWNEDLYIYLYGLLRSYKDLGLCLHHLGPCSYDTGRWQQHGKLCGTGYNANATGSK